MHFAAQAPRSSKNHMQAIATTSASYILPLRLTLPTTRQHRIQSILHSGPICQTGAVSPAVAHLPHRPSLLRPRTTRARDPETGQSHHETLHAQGRAAQTESMASAVVHAAHAAVAVAAAAEAVHIATAATPDLALARIPDTAAQTSRAAQRSLSKSSPRT